MKDDWRGIELKRGRWWLPFILIFSLMLLTVAACQPPAPLTPEKAIVGKWVNTRGGTIFFYENETGFIPGDETVSPVIPSSAFSYYFYDDTHLMLSLEGQPPIKVEIQLRGDEMAWFGRASDPDYVYKRTK